MVLTLNPEVSLIVPIHNEASGIWSNTIKLYEILKKCTSSFEIILIENGSTDNTLTLAKALKKNYSEIKVIELPESSLGDAIKTGIKSSKGSKLVYYPIDLSVELSFISNSIELLSAYDIIIATKRINGSDKRPIQRRIMSFLYHKLVRILFNTSLTDTTCAKAYRKKGISEFLNKIPGNSKIFETELIIEAEKIGRKIKELPVEVKENRLSRENLLLKIYFKFRDLLTSKLYLLSIIFGLILICSSFLVLILWGFENLVKDERMISIYLFFSGCQIILIGLLSNMIHQIRRELLSKLLK
ncbi:glycosyltransferase [Candidatus Bathyarchaeota archaeon]|nr:glycosyltransferase [Candidatus Bathyarchaeota archaeon]